MALILACLLVHRARCQVGARQGKWVKSNPKQGNNPNIVFWWKRNAGEYKREAFETLKCTPTLEVESPT
jgi:hypothetical protein